MSSSKATSIGVHMGWSRCMGFFETFFSVTLAALDRVSL